jgi:molybdopterin-containing oxidoreductase family iron-sulfur binding subunit
MISAGPLIVGFEADFLGTWISPVEFTAQYAAARKLEQGNPEMNRHIHFETGMSITGSNADVRYAVRPRRSEACSTNYKVIADRLSVETMPADAAIPDHIRSVAEELIMNKGKALLFQEAMKYPYSLQSTGSMGCWQLRNTLSLLKPSCLRKVSIPI